MTTTAPIRSGDMFLSADPREYRLVEVTGEDIRYVYTRNARATGHARTNRVLRSQFYDDLTTGRPDPYTGQPVRRRTGYVRVERCPKCRCCAADACGKTVAECTPLKSPVLQAAYMLIECDCHLD